MSGAGLGGPSWCVPSWSLLLHRPEISCFGVNCADYDFLELSDFVWKRAHPQAMGSGLTSFDLWDVFPILGIPNFFRMPKQPFSNHFYSLSLCCYYDRKTEKRKLRSQFVSWGPFQQNFEDVLLKSSISRELKSFSGSPEISKCSTFSNSWISLSLFPHNYSPEIALNTFGGKILVIMPSNDPGTVQAHSWSFLGDAYIWISILGTGCPGIFCKDLVSGDAHWGENSITKELEKYLRASEILPER